MSEPSLTFSQQMCFVITTGFFTLGGAFVVLAGNFINEVIKGNRAIKLERLKIHDIEKKNAYKELLIFSKYIQNNSFPACEYKDRAFESYMKKNYDKILANYPYYTRSIIDILDEFDINYNCLTSSDLTDIADEIKEDFIEKKLFEKAKELYGLVMKEIKEWT